MFLQGLGCTYSFCGKYESCADCVTDPFCGWCDSSRSCLGGFAAGPPGISCPAWFYYHCYTVGDERCSRDIMVGEEEKNSSLLALLVCLLFILCFAVFIHYYYRCLKSSGP